MFDTDENSGNECNDELEDDAATIDIVCKGLEPLELSSLLTAFAKS